MSAHFYYLLRYISTQQSIFIFSKTAMSPGSNELVFKTKLIIVFPLYFYSVPCTEHNAFCFAVDCITCLDVTCCTYWLLIFFYMWACRYCYMHHCSFLSALTRLSFIFTLLRNKIGCGTSDAYYCANFSRINFRLALVSLAVLLQRIS